MKTTKRSAPRKTPPSIRKKPVERRKPIGAAKPDRPIASSPISDLVAPDRAAHVQAALYAIASAASSVQDMQEFYAAMHRIVGELMYAKNFFIALYDELSDLLSFPYFVDEKDEVLPPQPLANFRGATGWVLRHGQTIADVDGSWATAKARGEAEEVGTVGEEGIAVPLKIENKTIGVVFIQSYTPGIGYQAEDVKVLEFVAQHIATALTRARAIEETRQRNAELSIINSVQAGLASKLDMQSIYDLVGDKIREIFDAQVVIISILDRVANQSTAYYAIERGVRLANFTLPIRERIVSFIDKTHQPLVINTDAVQRSKEFGIEIVPGTESAKALVFAPLIVGSEVKGAISLQNLDRENAFSDSDIRLLQTLANSMSVALENARLFDEVQTRNREITETLEQQTATSDILRVIAQSPTDVQPVLDVIARHAVHLIDGVFSAVYRVQGQMIDEVARANFTPSAIEVGRTSYPAPLAWDSSLSSRAVISRGVIHIPDTQNNPDIPEMTKRYAAVQNMQCILFVPMIREGDAIGSIGVGKNDPAPFTDKQITLLQTFAQQAVIAIENVRLFNELNTRNREITEALEQQTATSEILSVTANSPTDVQPVLDVVAEHSARLCDSYDALIVQVEGDHYRSIAQWGPVPTPAFDVPLNRDTVTGRAIIDRSIVHVADLLAEPESEFPLSRQFSQQLSGQRTLLAVPMLREGRAIGAIVIRRQEVNPFTDKQISLLQTFADQAAIAIENVRLFNETKRLLNETEQRAAELTVINSVQEGLASKLEMQAIYDLVGEKIRQIFDAQVVDIITYDRATDLSIWRYSIEKGVRDYPEPRQPLGFSGQILRTRQPIMINQELMQRAREVGSSVMGGAESKSYLGVPLMIGEEARGVISLQNVDREQAFSDSDLRLLSTLASSMSVALENARLFDETTQRAAELALINSVQAGLASQLDVQAIFDLVGDKIRDIFDAQVVVISTVNQKSNLRHDRYVIERGQRFYLDPRPLDQDGGGFGGHVIKTRQPLLVNQDVTARGEEFGSGAPTAGEEARSVLYVPMLVGDESKGLISLQNLDRENAFTESDVRLLTTLASSMSVALENARLFDETTRLLKETDQRAAELAIINSVQQGLASKLEMQSIYDLVGDKIRDLFDAQSILMAIFDLVHRQRHVPYMWEKGQRLRNDQPAPFNQLAEHLIATKQTIVINEDAEIASAALGMSITAGTETMRSGVFVPLVASEAVRGFISLQNVDRENAFSESDVRLLQTLANSMSVALENARLFDETQRLLKETDQRAAELSIINSVQQGLASKLDMQSIYDLVGDKIRDIFDARTMIISSYDHAAEMTIFNYSIEKGERYYPTPMPFTGLARHLIRTRQLVLVNEDMETRVSELGMRIVPGTELGKSALFVPLTVGDTVHGGIALYNYDRENAFSDSDVRLLTTLASSMSVALENARLFDETTRLLKETDQRAAELSIINSVQQGLASKLDMQSIYDLVGDKINEIFDVQGVGIMHYNHTTRQIHNPYVIERGQRFYPAPAPFTVFAENMIRTKQVVVINQDMERQMVDYGMRMVPGTEMAKAIAFVPLIVADQVNGVISLENIDHENAFSESDVRLLSTLASSMSVALENARLFDETQRLLKETDQRAAELAIINSVQQGLASKLDMQSIYDLVGDKIRDIFDAQVVMVLEHDHVQNLSLFRYTIEKGVRLHVEPRPPVGFSAHILKTRQTLVINQDMEQRSLELGSPVIAGDDIKSYLGVPLIVGDEVKGVISLQNIDRENAFSESDVRLLNTLASSMSVALENARLFDETQRLLKETDQRAAELSIINSVQQGLASKLDVQSVYDLVGEKIREIFDAQAVAIMIFDRRTNLLHYPYIIEKGERIRVDSDPFDDKGFAPYIIRTKQSLMFNTEVAKRAEEFGSYLLGGEEPKSYVGVPLISGDEARGVITLSNIDRENAFTDSDLRLLTTLSSSMSVALENARLFDETTRLLKETDQRAAELALINSVQEGLASKLDVQSVYDLVGDKIRDIFDAQVVQIMAYDRDANRCYWRYMIEKGERQYTDPTEPRGFSSYILKNAQPLMLNEGVNGWWREHLGTPPTVLAGEMAQSYLGVPLIIGAEARGVISLQNVDREHAFAESDLRLLLTLASSMSVALENARLFDAERQRAQELEIINSVGEALASQLDMQAVYDLVGDKIRSIFDAQAVTIATYDRETNLIHYPYMIERGQRQQQAPLPITQRGFSAHIMQTRQPLMINQETAQRAVEYGSTIIGGGEMAKSYLGVPLVIGGEARGVISLQNIDRENAFSDSDLRLLTTLSSSMGVALENARLFAETNRRASEMSALTDIGREISSTLDLEAVIDRIALRAQEVLKAGTSAVYLLEPDGLTLRPIAAVGDYSQEVLTSRSRLGEGIIGSVAQSGVAESITDTAQDPRTLHMAGTPEEAHGEKMMVAPLFARDHVIGAMAVWRDAGNSLFAADDLGFLVGLSRQAAIAIQNARLFEESQKRANETAALNEIGREISATLDINVVLERITQSARDLLIGDTSAVYLVQPDGETLKAVVAIGDIVEQIKASAPKLGTGIVGSIAQTGVPEFINNTVLDQRAVHIAGTSNDDAGKKIMVAPLPAKDRILGVMAVWRDVDRPLFTQTDLDFLTGLARQAVIAIDNARLFDEVQQQKQYSESLVQYSPVAIVTSDLNNIVVSWNPGAEKLFGYKPAEAVGRNLDELITTAEQRVEAKKYSQQTMLGERIHAITRRLRKDGSFVDVELSSVPVKMGGSGPRSYVAIYHDITELQRAKQEAESANSAKSAFLATMSHEIRTPMNAIIGMSGLILDTPLNGEQREFAEIIRNSGDALLMIINDILDFSKIEAGKMDMESQPFDLRECLEGTLDLIATRAYDKGLDLAYMIDEHVPPTILGDITRVRQIVLNLLTNAVKFTEKGEVVLDVKPEGSIGPNQKSMTLHFTVRDTGLGIPPDRMGRLFQSFSQVDASTARKYGGTGLGLVISKRLSEMMGGNMWAISEGVPGKGAIFHFTIKTQAADAPATSTRRDLRGVQAPLTEKRILIVDDNATNRRILTLQTQKWGMQPRDTASPLQALDWIKHGDPFDVAILDMHMPEMDGLELAQAIRESRDPKALPLIMFTSLGRREGGADSIEFAAHLTKPIKPSQLFDALVSIFVEQPTLVRKAETIKTQFDPEMAHKHPLRILLAEDNAVNQKLALRLLQQMGYRADVAGNGLEAIEAVERQKYDVILMDVQMPEMDGLDATRAIVARWPKGVRPQIIAMTANAMQGDREMCLEAGMDDYMTKPIRIDELVAALLRSKPTIDQPQLPLSDADKK